MTVGRARTMAEPRRARDGAAPGDPARLLDVDRLAAGSIFALFSLTMLAFVVNTGPMSQTPWGLTAAAALIAAAGLVIAPGPDRLTSTRLVAILALTAYCNVAMVWQFTPAEWPGWASWNFGMTALVMIGVAFRGRILWSWAGIALMAAVAISWRLRASLSMKPWKASPSTAIGSVPGRIDQARRAWSEWFRSRCRRLSMAAAMSWRMSPAK